MESGKKPVCCARLEGVGVIMGAEGRYIRGGQVGDLREPGGMEVSDG